MENLLYIQGALEAADKHSFKSLEIIGLVFVTITFLHLLGLAIGYFKDPLRDIPGPWLARWTRLWFQRLVVCPDAEKKNLMLHRKLGPIVRITPRTYSIDDPDAARVIYGIGSTTFDKSDWYIPTAEPGRTSLFTERKRGPHAEMKRKLGSTYSASNLSQYEPFVDSCISILLQRFQEIAASGRTTDIGRWLQYWALDVIGQITFSRRFGVLDHGEDKNELVKAMHQSFAYSNLLGVYPFLHPYAWQIKNLLKSNGEQYLMNFVQKQVFEHKSRIESARDGPLDFVHRWLNVHESNPDKMSMREILVGAGHNVGAGSDTVAATLSAIMFYVCKNPVVLTKLRIELDEARQQGRVSDMVKFQETTQLPYLHAVIKESLRMHPVAAVPLLRVVPAGGAIIAGRHFSEGDVVGINPYVAHHNKTVFGVDADEFRPERWLVGKEQVREMDRYFMAWGLGSRACIGKHIATLEMFKIIPLLFLSFDIRLQNPDAELESINQVVNRVAELRYYITPRNV